MFGYRCCFVSGNLFAGLHKRDMLFRLSGKDQAVLLRIEGAALAQALGSDKYAARTGLLASTRIFQRLSARPRWLQAAAADIRARPAATPRHSGHTTPPPCRSWRR